ncbi:MAG: bifunctional diaminohydroxyphosphoribosylaminopyrimidine deaminase/5-amino-6-(5-phosphoribosylamino)uracil reductase RibD [Planctomycetales bacterium]|nr:bifunctional diaminohydroxyphosphoribosylaminopyrimidine deaminase/5-amino-6-(5-phosphoribosylamino)uracil reductase RibD [Planctomycetales bacterium]
MKSHKIWMAHALELARRGLGRVEPNPMVGCVLVSSKGELLGEGFHAYWGGPHAETVAIEDAKQRYPNETLKGATAYVTLEPCCHHGKTPPCTDALLDAQVGQVVIGCRDPYQTSAGRGLERLREAGLQVELGVLENEAQELIRPFLKLVEKKLPFVIAKWAMSLDGKIATRTGDSRWISNQASRNWVHQLRARVDAILVGIGTALADDPLLMTRCPQPVRTARRVVVDTSLALPVESKLVTSARDVAVLIWGGPTAETAKADALRSAGCEVVLGQSSDANERLKELLQYLATQYRCTNLLVEGGGKILGSLFDLQLVDQCEVFIASKIIGGREAPSPILGRGIVDLSHGQKCSMVQMQTHFDEAEGSTDSHWTIRIVADT